MFMDWYRRASCCFAPDGRCDRRALLRGALLGAGGLVASGESAQGAAFFAGAVRRDLPRVAVVGAGFAGLACADELAALGYDVTVFEARDRSGGRVRTLRDFAAGKVIESGGELIGPNQPTWMAYARRFGLTFNEMPWPASDTLCWGGKLLSAEAARALWGEMRSALERLNGLAEPIDADQPWSSPGAAELDRRSLQDWIDRLDVSPRCRELIAIQMTGINGLIPAWQSLLGMLAIVKGGGLQKFWDETDTLHCVGGADQLARRLATSLVERRGAASLRTVTAVRSIFRRGNALVLSLSDGTDFIADDLVLTVPPTTWNKIGFDPPLPAALTVPMAASTKYLAVFPSPVWREMGRQANAMSDGPVQLTWETSAGQGEDGEHVLVAFAGGCAADECRGWEATDRDRRYREEIDRLFPGVGEKIVRGRLVDWVSDPWARGTYSFPAPGQVTTVGPILSAGHGPGWHFAGEHTCYAFTGWMEGALRSGVSLANRLATRDGVMPD
jgi:monoamine oxidase